MSESTLRKDRHRDEHADEQTDPKYKKASLLTTRNII